MVSPYVHLTDTAILYYLHIPKTAGTSFTNVIRTQFVPDAIYQPNSIQEFLNTPPEVVNRTRFLVGHLVYDLKPVFTQTPIYITMLRDPVERTISEYAQIKRAPEHAYYSVVKDQSLLEYVKDPRNVLIYGNLQTRFVGVDSTLEIGGGWNEIANPAVLKRAVERLETFAFVGLAERFDESVEVLCDTFGWDIPESLRALNIGTNHPSDISQEAIDIIHEHTQQDKELYETAKRLFEARYEQMLAKYPERVQQHKAVASKNVSLNMQQSVIDKLVANNTLLENRIVVLENHLIQIKSSFGWRFILKMAALRRKLIPEGSAIERLYLIIRNRLV